MGSMLPKTMHANTFMDTLSSQDDDILPCDASDAWVSACVASLMSRHGVQPRHQATSIAQICAISVSQARRKLRGAVWLFSEIHTLCSHHGESLDAVFGAEQSTSAPSMDGILLVDGLELPCLVRAGAVCAAPSHVPAQLLTSQEGACWYVGTPARLDAMGLTGKRHTVAQLQTTPPDARTAAHIAVLDDDESATQALVDWFEQLGFKAHGYTRSEALEEDLAQGFDAFVLDLMLSGGQTSQAIVEQIRRRQPEAPIVLLTGELRDGKASESTLAALMRNQRITFFEKPVRPAMITAAIQNSLDRLKPAT
jgi:CheY-like chemotaxis protein